MAWTSLFTSEELQSTVEELETTNEELQSTNEELQTINEELRERTTTSIAPTHFSSRSSPASVADCRVTATPLVREPKVVSGAIVIVEEEAAEAAAEN